MKLSGIPIPQLALLFLILLLTLSTQSQTVVTYDFENNTLDKAIPFDELVTFKFVNAPEETEFIHMRLHELNKIRSKFYKDFIDERSAIPSTTKRRTFEDSDILELNKNAIHILLDSIPVIENVPTYKVCPYYFPPNAEYAIQIERTSLTDLTDGQKKKLISSIETELVQEFNDLFNAQMAAGLTDLSAGVKSTVQKIEGIIRAKANAIFPNEEIVVGSNDSIIDAYNLSIRNYLTEFLNLKSNLDSIAKDTLLFDGKKYQDFISGFEHFKEEEYNKYSDAIESITNALMIKSALTDQIERIEKEGEELRKALIGNIAFFEVQVVELVGLTYVQSKVENSKNYIGADIGGAYIPGLDQSVVFSTASIYLRPVKRSIPLSRYKGLKDILLTRLSLNVGISVNEISVEDKIQGFSFNDDSATDRALMVGLGFRILPFLKVDGGYAFYRYNDPNPLIDNWRHDGAFYFGASIDFDVSSMFKSTFGGQTTNPD